MSTHVFSNSAGTYLRRLNDTKHGDSAPVAANVEGIVGTIGSAPSAEATTTASPQINNGEMTVAFTSTVNYIMVRLASGETNLCVAP